ncbi:MAG: hypothetical protein J6A41_04590 [Ruminiclostridium sp.]|nr:hypothetical protein [Ruminiclostridium sp.]
MYCEKCGKKLEDGEVCSCKATAEAAPAETPAVETTAVVAAPAQQTLPDTQKLADGVKAIGSNPVVTELISVIKGAFTAPVKQTGKSAKRTDILWIILAAVEAVIASVSITVVFRHLLHVFLGSAAGSMGGKISFGDFAEGLAAMDAGVWKTFGFAILGVLIMYVIGTALMFIISLIYKRNASFASVCNMLATANIPGTALMLLALIFGWIYAPISVFLMIGAGASVTVLSYMGMQKLGEGKFNTSPFWLYIINTIIVTAVATLIGTGFAGTIFETMLDRLMGSMF